jgi:ribosomal protein L40E
MKTLVCPHCDTEVSERAHVCRGCGAEIIRGATRNEQATGGCALSTVALVLCLIAIGFAKPPSQDLELGFLIIVGLLTVTVVTYQLGKLIARIFRRSKLRFLRTYQHQ